MFREVREKDDFEKDRRCGCCGHDIASYRVGSICRTPKCEAGAFWKKYKNHLDKLQKPV